MCIRKKRNARFGNRFSDLISLLSLNEREIPGFYGDIVILLIRQHLFYLLNGDLLMKRYLTIAVIFLMAFAGTASAQKVAVKTNALYWATTTPNIGMEFSMSPRWTFEIAGGYNPWLLNKETNMKAKHYLVTPEVRYWFCESFNGHFLGVNANYTQFNVGGVHVLNPFYKSAGDGPFIDACLNSRVEGWAAGAGITYGYSWIISPRWNMEFNLGLGYWYSDYDRYENRKCGLFQDSAIKHVVGLTDLGLSFIYMIR